MTPSCGAGAHWKMTQEIERDSENCFLQMLVHSRKATLLRLFLNMPYFSCLAITFIPVLQYLLFRAEEMSSGIETEGPFNICPLSGCSK